MISVGGTVTHFDPVSFKITEIDTATLSEWVVIAAQLWPNNNQAALADAQSYRLATVKLPTFEIVEQNYLTSPAMDIASTPDLEHIYAVTRNGIFWDYQIAADTVTHIDIQPDARRIALKPPNYFVAWMVCSENNTMYAIDILNGVVIDLKSFDAPPSAVAFTPDGRQAFVALTGVPGRLLTFDADSLRLLDDFSLGAGPFDLAVSPDGRYLAVTDSMTGMVTFRDLLHDRQTWDFQIGSRLGKASFTKHGEMCFIVSTGNSSVVRVMMRPEGPVPLDTLFTPPTASQVLIWDTMP